MLGDSDSILRQVSVGKDGWNSSKRWSNKGPERSLHQQMEGLNLSSDDGLVPRKRVMVVVDHSARAKHAVMWALTHVVNKGDVLTLLHIIPPQKAQNRPFPASSPHLSPSLGSLCKACKPEVEVEALEIQGHRLPTVLSQVKKLEACVLVLGQKKPTPVNCLFRSSSDDFVEQCINNAECLTLAVRKQSRGVGGYLISTRWYKNFWLLA